MEFEKIDDFAEYLNFRDGTLRGRRFERLVDRHFDVIENADGSFTPNRDDLLLCLLEIVTLVENDVIGETILRSHFENSDVHEFIAKYRKVVEIVKNDPSCVDSISGYKQWYSMGTFILMVSNPHLPQPSYPLISSWDGQPVESVKDYTKKRLLYATKNEHLSEEDVRVYLKFYYEQLLVHLKFNEFPNICIIVKSIAASDGSKSIPIGNLYLHFATRTAKTKSFYVRFINDFMRVWYFDKSHEIITKIQELAISETIENESIISKEHLPAFTDRSKKGRLWRRNLVNGYCLADYFNKLYLSDGERSLFESQLFKITDQAIELYHKIKVAEKGNNLNAATSSTIYSQLRKLFIMKRIECLKNKFDLENFKNILFYREIFKIGVLVYKFDPLKLHYNLTQSIGYNDKTHYSINSLKSALWTERLIPCPGGESYQSPKVVHDILNCLGEVEKKYLERYESNSKEMRTKLA